MQCKICAHLNIEKSTIKGVKGKQWYTCMGHLACRTGSCSGGVSEWEVGDVKAWDLAVHHCRLSKQRPASPSLASAGRSQRWNIEAVSCSTNRDACRTHWKHEEKPPGSGTDTVTVRATREREGARGAVQIRNQDGEVKERGGCHGNVVSAMEQWSG